MTTSCSASNLGTLTRIPSAEQQQHASGGTAGVGGGGGGSLTRTISVEQYAVTRVPSAEQYATRVVPSTEQYASPIATASANAVTRLSTGDHHHHHHHHHHHQYPTSATGTLTRVPSTEQYPTGTLTRIPSAEQYANSIASRTAGDTPHHHHHARVPSIEPTTRNDQIQRIPSSDYQSPNSLRDPNAR